jgi:hypothetical protein
MIAGTMGIQQLPPPLVFRVPEYYPYASRYCQPGNPAFPK